MNLLSCALSGDLERIRQSVERNEPISDLVIFNSIDSGSIPLVSWLWDHGYSVTKLGLMSSIIKNNNLIMLEWLYDHGVRFDEYDIAYAAKCERYGLVGWLLDHDCPTDHFVISALTRRGKRALLRRVLARHRKNQME